MNRAVAASKPAGSKASPYCSLMAASSSPISRSTRSLVMTGPSARLTSLCSHCQTWEREISAVAASSIRLKIATAPLPASQLARYCSPTLMLFRSPASVMPPGVLAMDSRSSAVTLTSSRSLPSWFDWSPSTPSNTSRQIGTRSGWATQEPSKPSLDSRVLSSRTLASAVAFTSASRLLGMKAAMPPMACAPRPWQVLTSSSV